MEASDPNQFELQQDFYRSVTAVVKVFFDIKILKEAKHSGSGTENSVPRPCARREYWLKRSQGGGSGTEIRRKEYVWKEKAKCI